MIPSYTHRIWNDLTFTACHASCRSVVDGQLFNSDL